MGSSSHLKKRRAICNESDQLASCRAQRYLGLLYACIGLLFIPFAVLGGSASMISEQSHGAISSAVFLFLGLLAPFFYGAIGFVFGALWAWIYNLVAGWVGGIEIDLQGTGTAMLPVPQM